MKLLILFGPPAVGKMTIGTLLEAQTDYKLFHNHMVMDGVMHIFGVSSPAEDRLSRLIREAVIEEAANSGIDLLLTYVWNFGLEKGKRNIDAYKRIYESRGGEVRFVELVAPLAVRVARAGHPDRWRAKTHAPKPEDIATLETERDFRSPQPFFYPDIYTQLDTTHKSPETIVREILEWDKRL